MKVLISILITLCSCFVIAQNNNPFQSLDYDKVVAYEFNGNGGRTIDVILNSMPSKLDSTVELNDHQVKRIEGLLCKRSTYGNSTAACFDPHFALVYYLDEKIVAQIDICLMCNFLVSTLNIPVTNENKFDKGTDYERPANGFSSEARSEIDLFIRSLGFTKYNVNLNSIFDQ